MTDAMGLFAYQKTGAQWLADGRHRFLADEMGLGKTAQGVAACDAVGAAKILVLCPGVARHKWCREFTKFSLFGYPTTPILDSVTPIPTDGVVTISAALTRNDKVRKQIYAAGPWDVVIVDEARALKERKARITTLCYNRRGLAHRTRHFWLFDGTPAPNHYGEWWTHLRKFGFYDGDYQSFISRFCACRETDYGRKIIGGRNRDELRELLAPFVLRRLEADVAGDWPALRVGERYLDWPDELPEALQQHLDLNDSGNLDPDYMNELMPPSLRRQWGLAKIGPTAIAATEFLNAQPDKKLVLFGYHPAVLDGLVSKLRAFNPVVVHGRTAGDGSRQVDQFADDPTCRVFCGQLIAAGSAIDLVAASTVWIVEADWVPSNNEQAIKRVHRMGQKHPVLAQFLMFGGTIDESIQAAYARKARDLVALLDPGRESVLAKMKDPARQIKRDFQPI